MNRPRIASSSLRGVGWVLLLLLLAVVAPARAQDPNACDEPGDFPDVIVGDLEGVVRYGDVGGVTGYAIGTWSCNIGTCWLNWISNTPQHPVITQALFRLKDGRFEQIGQSWLKHGFFALSDELCSSGCIPTNGNHLGVNCADPYTASLNGQQGGLGPKFEVNPVTGAFPYPFTSQGQTGDAIYKRLQVHNADLDPTLNPDALYFAESQYIAADDAAAGRDDNNSSYRPMNATFTGGNYNLNFTGTTVRTKPAIMAWGASDPAVKVQNVDVPADGRFIVATKSHDLGTGMWHYEYAVNNFNSYRAAGSLSIPIPSGATIENVGFHDVDHHSGEPFSGEDWAVTIDTDSIPNRIIWSTYASDVDPDANALRWGTLYNYRFDCDRPPTSSTMTLGLFRPGAPAEMTIAASGPVLCDSDGVCEPGETTINCPADCQGPCGNELCEPGEDSCTCSADCGLPDTFETLCDDGLDDDCDGDFDCQDLDCCSFGSCGSPDNDGDLWGQCEDCDDSNNQLWDTPGEARDLLLDDNGVSGTLLTWSPPLDPGAVDWAYDVVRSENPQDWVVQMACLPDAIPADEELLEPDVPAAGVGYYYLVRATNSCPQGEGLLGRRSDDSLRAGASCP